jgi:hypothetical protein
MFCDTRVVVVAVRAGECKRAEGEDRCLYQAGDRGILSWIREGATARILVVWDKEPGNCRNVPLWDLRPIGLEHERESVIIGFESRAPH